MIETIKEFALSSIVSSVRALECCLQAVIFALGEIRTHVIPIQVSIRKRDSCRSFQTSRAVTSLLAAYQFFRNLETFPYGMVPFLQYRFRFSGAFPLCYKGSKKCYIRVINAISLTDLKSAAFTIWLSRRKMCRDLESNQEIKCKHQQLKDVT